MKIELQVCTLEQAMKLQDLKVVQESTFYWNIRKSEHHPEHIHYGWTSDAIASAYTLAELFVMLEAYAETYITDKGKWNSGILTEHFDTAAQSSADRLIELLETAEINIHSVNQRLQS